MTDMARDAIQDAGEPPEDVRWRAVEERNPFLDGSFVYAVRSTRIYCRPSCPSRRPARQRVRFFPSPAQAEASGFRACRRCKPREVPADVAVTRVLAACRVIEQQAPEIPTLSELGKAVGSSPHHLQRTFKKILGVSPRQYADERRIERLRSRLREGEEIAGALYAAGYGSSSRLYEKAPAQLGMTPARYQKHGRGETVRYTVVPCPLGRLLVAATARGVCRVAMGQTVGELAGIIRDEFSEATVRRDDKHLRGWVASIVRYLEGVADTPDVPLDVRGTAFQRRVWEALREIPRGETRTYGDIAKRIGKPRAVRAVANACGDNPTALVVPCHRVVRSDGKPGGYRWGEDRKKALLALEDDRD